MEEFKRLALPLSNIKARKGIYAVKKIPKILDRGLKRLGVKRTDIIRSHGKIIENINAGINQAMDRAKKYERENSTQVRPKNLTILWQLRIDSNRKESESVEFKWLFPVYLEFNSPPGRNLIPIQPTYLDQYRQAHRKLLERLRMSPPPPHEYAKLYDELKLGELYRLAADLGGPPTVCQVCFELLQGNQKFYCGQGCQNIAKVRKSRKLHPERKLKRP